MDSVAVFGIGSTNFRYVAASLDGTFLTEISVEPSRPRELATQVCDAVADLRSETSQSIEAVAVSTTGLVEKSAGVVRDLDTPEGDVVPRIDLRATVEKKHGLPVYLENDCNAAALGEWYYGAGDDYDCLAHVTFGTGIGGGVVEHGRLVRGNRGQAGEFGHIPVAPEHDLESTGVRGAWEAFCSGRGIPQYVAYRRKTDGGARSRSEDSPEATERDADLTARDVFARAANGDQFTRSCLDRIGRYNAAGIAAICNSVNPDLITIGGSVALHNPDVILDGIETHLDDYLFVERPSIQTTPLGDEIGLYGAMAIALQGRRKGTKEDALSSVPPED